MTMSEDSKTKYENRYKSGNIPWDHKIPDSNLTDLVNEGAIKPGNTLDIGCGNGDNAIWLAKKGFQVTGCDIAQTAIVEAGKRASSAGISCSFHELDFLKKDIPGTPFEFVFDRGCYHTFREPEDRVLFVEKVSEILIPGGFWLTVIGSNNAPQRGIGPPQLPASDLVVKCEPFFEIISLRAGHFGSDQEDPPEAWIALLKRRAAVNSPV